MISRQIAIYCTGVFIFLLLIFTIDACSKNTLRDSLNKLKINKVKAIQGVHIPSNALVDTKNIIKHLDYCQQMNINAIFIPTWNNGKIIFPSQVTQDVLNIRFDRKKYNHRNPLRFLIKQAHKRKLKVFITFDFKVSTRFKSNTSFKKHKDYVAINAKGLPIVDAGLLSLNLLNTDIQNFTTNLIHEILKFYEPDGIQINTGLSSLSGYDRPTIKHYASEHQDKTPPYYAHDYAWIEWRSKILTAYTEKLYRSIKKRNSKLLIIAKPDEYPKCKIENLKDWTYQVRKGYTDIILPSLNSENLGAYRSSLDKIIKPNSEYLKLTYPYVTSKSTGQSLSEAAIKAIIDQHRDQGIQGEVVPYATLVAHKKYFKRLYKYKALFPKEVKQPKWKAIKNFIHRKKVKAGIADSEIDEVEELSNPDEVMEENISQESLDEQTNQKDTEISEEN